MSATLDALWGRKRKQPPAPTAPVDLTESDNPEPASKALKTQSGCLHAAADVTDAAVEESSSQPAVAQERKRKRPVLGQTESSDNPCGQHQDKAVAANGSASGQLDADSEDGKRKAKSHKQAAQPKSAARIASKQPSASAPDTHGSAQEQTACPAEDNKQEPGSDQPNAPSAERHAAAGQPQSQQDLPSTPQQEADLCKANKEQLLQQYQARLQSCLDQAKVAQPMGAMPQFADAQLNRQEVAAWLVGNGGPLTQVVQQLWQQLKTQDASTAQTQDSLRNCVIDLATRKSFGVKAEASTVADPLEEIREEHVWRWELRDAKVLPKAQRQQAQGIKKALLKNQEYMTVLHKACGQLASTAIGKAAETRLQKSLDKLQKLQQASASADAAPSTGSDSGTQPKAAAKPADNQQQQTVATVVGTVFEGQRNAELTQQNQSSDAVGTAPSAEHGDMDSDMKENMDVAQQQSAVQQKAEGSQLQKPDSGSQADKGQVLAEKKAQKEEAKAQKEAQKEKTKEEKEQQRLAKEAEKERRRAEKEAEKEKVKQEKEAEKEKVKQEKEAEKEKVKQEKEAEKEKAKQEKEAARKEKALKEAEKAKPVGFGSERVLKKSQNVFKSFFSARKPEPTVGDAVPMLSPPPVGIRLNLADATSNEEIEQQLADPWSDDQVLEAFTESLTAWKSRTKPKRLTGLPPSWACKPNAVERLQHSLQERYGQDYRPEALRTWRKKLLWHSSHHKREDCGPAYYGSWSKPAQMVRPRCWRVHEPGLDYEVESDEDWSEPEDGESLTDVEDSEMEDEEDSQADGFVVDDGYLSEGEGGPIDNDDFGAEVEGEVQSALAASGAPLAERYTHKHSMLMLEAALEKAQRAHRPLIITSLPGPDDPSQIHMDASLLSALDMQVLDANVFVTMPQLHEEQEAADSPKAKHNSGSAAKPLAKDAMEQALPDLVHFLLTHPDVKSMKQVCADFPEAYPVCKVTKKWLHGKLKDIAQWLKGQWVINAEALAEAGIEDAEAMRKQAQPQTAAAQPEAVTAERPRTSGPAPAAPAPAASAAVSTMHRFLRKASGSPVRKSALKAAPASTATGAGNSRSAPSAATAAAPKQGSPMVVDLCNSPVRPPASSSASPAATAGKADFASGQQAMDISQSPARDTTAPAEAAKDDISPKLGLAMEGPLSGSADPYWRRLSDQIVQGSIGSDHAEELSQVFAESTHKCWQGCVPASLLSALLKALACSSLAAPLRAAYADCIFNVVRSLASVAVTAPVQRSSGSEVWANNRASPPLASLPAIFSDPLLLVGIKDCLSNSSSDGAQLALSAAHLLCALLGFGLSDSDDDTAEPDSSNGALQAASAFRCKLAGESSWRKLLLDGLKSHEKQPFLSGYLCASLFYLLKDASSRQKLFADSAAQSAVTDALLDAAQSTRSLGVAKYGLKALWTLVKASQGESDAAKPSSSSPPLLQSAWDIAYTRIVDGQNPFGASQQTVKCLALQVMDVVFGYKEGQQIWKDADYSKQCHLKCATEYQAVHSNHAESQAVANKILPHLKLQ